MLGRFLMGPALATISSGIADVAGEWVLVSGMPKVSRHLAEEGVRVLTAASSPKDLRRLQGARLVALEESMPIASRKLGAVVMGTAPTPLSVLALARLVRTGGKVILVTSSDRASASCLALGVGLMELEQTRAGRFTVTHGVAVHL